MSQQSEIKESAHFQIYELGIGLLAPSTRSCPSLYSVCIDKVVILMGSLTLKTTTLPGSLSRVCPPPAQRQIQVAAVDQHPQTGSPHFPPAPPCSALSLVWPCQGLPVTHGQGIPDLEKKTSAVTVQLTWISSLITLCGLTHRLATHSAKGKAAGWG